MEPLRLSSFLRNDCSLAVSSESGRFYRNVFGAPERNNLEPFDAPALLEELENWTEILKSEPEVIHRLAAFAEAAEDDVDLDDTVSLDHPKPEVSL